jgi:hypothetical protein
MTAGGLEMVVVPVPAIDAREPPSPICAPAGEGASDTAATAKIDIRKFVDRMVGSSFRGQAG